MPQSGGNTSPANQCPSRLDWGPGGVGGSVVPALLCKLILTCLAAAACVQIAVSPEQETLSIGPTVIQTGHQIQDGLHSNHGLFTVPTKKWPEKAGCSALAGGSTARTPKPRAKPSRLQQLGFPFPLLVLMWDGGSGKGEPPPNSKMLPTLHCYQPMSCCPGPDSHTQDSQGTQAARRGTSCLSPGRG